MRVSFIIPVKELNDYVLETVEHLQGLDGDNWEAFVVTNEMQLAPWDDSRISIIESGRVGPADKRDLAAAVATGEILVFLDDDSYPDRNYLGVLRSCFADGHQVVGGPAITPPTDSYWQQVSGAMYLSRFSGGSPERYWPVNEPRYVVDWPTVNFAISSEAFMSVGGFDCKFWPGEDTFICDKLTTAGVKIWYCPELLVWHHRRGSIFGHLRQVGNYGLHRGFFARKFGGSSRRITYFAPTALVLVISLAAVFPSGTAKTICLALLAAYIVVQIVASLSIAPKTGFGVMVGALIYGFLSHIWYGIRFIQGFLYLRPLESRLR